MLQKFVHLLKGKFKVKLANGEPIAGFKPYRFCHAVVPLLQGNEEIAISLPHATVAIYDKKGSL